MANKNTKQLRGFVSKSQRQNLLEVSIDVPGKNYHNDSKPTLTTRRISLANSQNKRRNMEMVTLVNSNGDGTKYNVTKHLPIDSSRPVVFKNHKYIAETQNGYSQPRNIAS